MQTRFAKPAEMIRNDTLFCGHTGPLHFLRDGHFVSHRARSGTPVAINDTQVHFHEFSARKNPNLQNFATLGHGHGVHVFTVGGFHIILWP